jgi:hypothetical protein
MKQPILQVQEIQGYSDSGGSLGRLGLGFSARKFWRVTTFRPDLASSSRRAPPATVPPPRLAGMLMAAIASGGYNGERGYGLGAPVA